MMTVSELIQAPRYFRLRRRWPPVHRVLQARWRRRRTKLRAMKTSNCVINTSVFHAAVMACAILSSSLFPSEPALAQGCPIPSFGPPRAFGAGVGPYSVVVGDFNGDGKPDILWQNTSTGERGLYLMDGTTVSSWVSLPTVPTAWQITGTGDFNGDGNTDILWQNTVTGE